MFLVKWVHAGEELIKELISHVHHRMTIVAADNGVVTTAG